MISRLMISACRNDPLVSLNYAVFLYNTGDKASAARQFHNFEKRLHAAANKDVDPEVTRCDVLLQRSVFFAFLKFYPFYASMLISAIHRCAYVLSEVCLTVGNQVSG